LDPSDGNPLKTGTIVGVTMAAAAAAEILLANQRALNPSSAAVVAVLWLGGGAAVGAFTGWMGGRAARVFQKPAVDAGGALAVASVGQVFLPLGFGLLGALAFLLLRWLRRLALPRFPRLDQLVTPGLALAAGALMIAALPPLPAGSGRSAVRAIGEPPLPGSVPGTITVHTGAGFPDVAATHVALRSLDSELPGRIAALWSGRAPARTPVGTGIPRRLPGGGGVAWIPERPSRNLLARFPTADSTTPPFLTRAGLERYAEAAGIPVLRTPPSEDDPPLFLRILESASPVDRATAEAIRKGSAWIDVRILPGEERLAISGLGVELAPSGTRASLLDVTPTALHLLGLSIPRSCDGRVLVEILDDAGPAARPLRYKSPG
jgi:hypothetical protein